jgi:hypothetical protein
VHALENLDERAGNALLGESGGLLASPALAMVIPFGGSLAAGDAGGFATLQRLSEVGDELAIHHMPQAAAGFTSRAEGGALVMTQAEHELTRTYLGRGAATARAEAGMPFRRVLARDIRDVRGIVGSKYNEGLQELIQYYRETFPALVAK